MIKIRANSLKWPILKIQGNVNSLPEDFYQKKTIKINVSLGPKSQFLLLNNAVCVFPNHVRQKRHHQIMPSCDLIGHLLCSRKRPGLAVFAFKFQLRFVAEAPS